VGSGVVVGVRVVGSAEEAEPWWAAAQAAVPVQAAVRPSASALVASAVAVRASPLAEQALQIAGYWWARLLG